MRETNGIPETIEQKGTDADGTLYTGVLSITYRSHPNEEGNPCLRLSSWKRRVDKPLDHDLWIARFHRKDNLVIVVGFSDPDEFILIYHSSGGVAKSVHNAPDRDP